MVKYLKEDPPDPRWTRLAFELQLQGRIVAEIVDFDGAPRLRARVECPRCGGTFNLDVPSTGTYVHGGVLSHSAEGLREPDRDSEVDVSETIICRGPRAEGAPADAKGCGAAFNVWARRRNLGDR